MAVRFDSSVRLRSRAQFTAVQEDGRRVSSRFFTVLARPNTTGKDRLGLVASRRLGGAVTRNRAKRRLRAAFRLLPDAVRPEGASSLDVVVIARREIIEASFAALESELQSALARLRRMRVK